ANWRVSSGLLPRCDCARQELLLKALHFLPTPKTVLLSRTGRHTLWILSEQKTLLVWLGAICGFVWIAAAIHPLDHQSWSLENILLVIFVAALALTYRRQPRLDIQRLGCLSDPGSPHRDVHQCLRHNSAEMGWL